ncbi:uncharacterized protein LOC143877104 isoform X3 [Tasmannia lanceolata]|uniref:uncharacterized protein LOC143877104 isoform X3 n=1 Tax=Tasmannia lanceolata TaxID=3420 RepID=UPI0040632614
MDEDAAKEMFKEIYLFGLSKVFSHNSSKNGELFLTSQGMLQITNRIMKFEDLEKANEPQDHKPTILRLQKTKRVRIGLTRLN